MRRVATAVLAAALLAGCSSSGSSGSATTTTTESSLPAGMTGPITGGRYGIPYLAMPDGWADRYGYTEDEYFLSGDATAYAATGELGADGRWDVAATGQPEPFTTRLVVRRPAKAADFNGTVVVEWLNVSAGRDSDPDFGFLADELLGQGYAYVSVSAQQVGVEPGGLGIEIPDVDPAALAPLKDWDPERYGDLHHPGDDVSYDIFTQAAAAAKAGPLGDLDVRHTIAVGESQSAFRLTTYVNAIQPVTHAFDGFLIHSRGEAAADLNTAQHETAPGGTQIRTDQPEPVVQFETETDLVQLGFATARQDNGDRLVTWETAGTAHADRSTLDYGVLAGRRWTDAQIDLSATCGAINDGPQQPVVQAAFAHLAAWVADGERPPASPRIDLDGTGAIVRDDTGIAVGGIRTPAVDAPTEVLTGANPSDQVICMLFGSSTPLTPDQLAARYTDHDDYVAQVQASAQQAVTDGYLLPRHAKAMVTAARDADIP